jgi:hypothetical protein
VARAPLRRSCSPRTACIGTRLDLAHERRCLAPVRVRRRSVCGRTAPRHRRRRCHRIRGNRAGHRCGGLRGTVGNNGKTVTIETAAATPCRYAPRTGRSSGDTLREGGRGAIGTVAIEVERPYVHLGVRLAADPQGYIDPLSVLPARLRPGSAPPPAISRASAAARPAPGGSPPMAQPPAPRSLCPVSPLLSEPAPIAPVVEGRASGDGRDARRTGRAGADGAGGGGTAASRSGVVAAAPPATIGTPARRAHRSTVAMRVILPLWLRSSEQRRPGARRFPCAGSHPRLAVVRRCAWDRPRPALTSPGHLPQWYRASLRRCRSRPSPGWLPCRPARDSHWHRRCSRSARSEAC